MLRLAFTTSLLCLSQTFANDITYEADVRPILKTHCFQCHGEAGVREAALDLRLARFILQGGDSGPAVKPGDPRQSLLLQRITDGEMPPESEGALSETEVAAIRQWIQSGAPVARPEPESLDTGQPYFTEEERRWWAFQPPAHAPVPAALAGSTDNPIDAFALEALRQSEDPQIQKLSMAPVADRATLVRRLFLDMLGVTPSLHRIESFQRDAHPDAWTRLVDRVLSDPRYGERWGRHWLDVAGYADSEGATDEDTPRLHAWHYRDYVIRSLNSDRPYSDFIRQQLAGDELVGWPTESLTSDMIESLAATGFLRMAPDPTGSGGIDQNASRNQVIADTIQIASGAILGLTVGCAQCHDHRYDPIPQSDYYRLRAIFEPALNWKAWQTPDQRRVSLYQDSDRQLREQIEAKAKKVDQQRKDRAAFFIDRTLEHELLMVEQSLREPLRTAFKTPSAKRTAEQKELLDSHTNVGKITEGSLYLYERRRESRAKDLETRRAEILEATLNRIGREAIAELSEGDQQAVLDAHATDASERSAEQKALVEKYPEAGTTEASLESRDKEAWDLLRQYEVAAKEIREFRIQEELKKLTAEAKEIRGTIPVEPFLRVLSEPSGSVPVTFVFNRGSHQQPGKQVSPGGLSILGAPSLSEQSTLQTSSRRLRYAQQLTSGQHPLVARVIANRLWKHHFGKGIVGTPGDFGALGDPPTHPRLLDFLASELVRNDWSIKRLHRLILTSRLYRQSSAADRSTGVADPGNRWLMRWPSRRLESEALRDVILDVSGQLDHEMYGQPIPVMEDAVGQIVLGKENLDGERKPTNPVPMGSAVARRSIYVQVRRSRPLAVLESFDVPDMAPNCTERPVSNVTPQSLMMMNSDFILNASEVMAQRLIRQEPDSTEQQIRLAWRLCYGQVPDPQQIRSALGFIGASREHLEASGVKDKSPAETALSIFCQALIGSNQFIYIE